MGQRWFDRDFDFTRSAAVFPELLERLGAAPGRAERLLGAVAEELSAVRVEDTWSMRENIAHLGDLEGLHRARLGELLAGVPVLRPADPANRKTADAGHSGREPEAIVADLRREREEFVAALGALAPADLLRAAVHPRLDRPMRMIDLALFVAEHDDHHLVRAAEIAAGLRLAEAPWSAPAPGLRARSAAHGALALRLLDIAPGFAADADCPRRHDVFVLSGALEVEIGGRSLNLTAGHAWSLDLPHRPRSLVGAQVVLVEPAA